MTKLTETEALEMLEAAKERSLKIRKGEVVPVVVRIADKGDSAFSIKVLYIEEDEEASREVDRYLADRTRNAPRTPLVMREGAQKVLGNGHKAKRYEMKMSVLGAVNFLWVQWFFVRLAFMYESNGRYCGWTFLKGVLPLTGWWSPYKYIGRPSKTKSE